MRALVILISGAFLIALAAAAPAIARAEDPFARLPANQRPLPAGAGPFVVVNGRRPRVNRLSGRRDAAYARPNWLVIRVIPPHARFRGIRLSLDHVTSTGRTLRRLARAGGRGQRRSIDMGLPADRGRMYAVRMWFRGRRWATYLYVPRAPAPVLTLDRAAAAPGGTLTAVVRNDGDAPLEPGGYGLERPGPEGWEPVAPGVEVVRRSGTLARGAERTAELRLPASLAPGRYRIATTVTTRWAPPADSGDLRLGAEFDVG